MNILALETEVAGVVEAQFTEEILRAEAAKAWELYQAGVLREMYFTADTNEAVLVLECGGADETPSHLASLPLVKAGLIDFRMMPLVPYPGFARLFADKRRSPLPPVQSRHFRVSACATMGLVKEAPPHHTIRRRSDEPKLQIGERVSLKDGQIGVVLARYTPSDARNEVRYIVEIISGADDGESHGRSDTH